ncbi:MAG: PEP-CTERM sorting domain-containing protein [Planctomycetota bacterium]
MHRIRLAVAVFSLCLFCSSPAIAIQEVYVDFDSILLAVDAGATPGMGGIPPADELYEYSPEQRGDILFYLNDLYAPHDVVFFDGLPAVPGSKSTVTLNKGTGGGADGIDFRNLSDDDGADVNTIALFKFLGKDAVTDPWTDDDVLIATANAVGHEAGHLMGLRHSDSFGPISTGIGSFPTDFSPTYPFPPGAPDTAESIMSLTTGFLLSFSAVTTPKFLSERSAIKLEIAKPGFTDIVLAETTGNQTLGMAQDVPLADFMLPYPQRPLPPLKDVPPGDLPLEVRTGISARGRVVTGALDLTDEEGGVLGDYFKFEAEAGTFVTIEVMSAILEDGSRYGDTADVVVVLIDGLTGAPIAYGPGTTDPAANDDDFDTSERGASLFDVELPVVADTDFGTGIGTYAVEVLSANDDLPFVDPGPGKDGMDTGSYELFIYQATIETTDFPPGRADFDLDLDVDIADLLTQQRGFGIPAGAVKGDGDVDNDGDVDDEDQFFAEVQLGVVYPAPLPVTVVPEPGSAWLLAAAGLAVATRRR